MTREDGLKLCDAHIRGTKDAPQGDVVSDGVTILPGMIEVKDGKVWEYFSTDSKNRINNENGNYCLSEKILGEQEGSYHFCNKACWEAWK